jgi:hypothetical protein
LNATAISEQQLSKKPLFDHARHAVAASKQGEAALAAQMQDSHLCGPTWNHYCRQSNHYPFPIPRATWRILPEYIEYVINNSPASHLS